MSEENPYELPEIAKEPMRKVPLTAFFPLFLGVAIAAGIWIGFRMNGNVGGVGGSLGSTSSFNKVEQILKFVDAEYVDEVDREGLAEKMIHTMLQDLDPHSYYISARDIKEYTDPLEGNFDGVGIEFLIQKDTLIVVHALEGGPSKSKGIMAGDRIIKVNDTLIAGVSVTNQMVTRLLKGKKGTDVKMAVQRRGTKKLIDFNITRAAIPIHSIDVSWMVDEQTGYVKLARFSKTTSDEFQKAAVALKAKGMKKMILDLRGNGGGVFDAATKLADHFLADKKLIVYTKGRLTAPENTFATSFGELENVEVVILIDNNSASASEIVAGALQDNDRGTIVGQRSFGKGLVQSHKPLPDGSAFRLTIARYYTPTGRCIQKPYDATNGYDDYYAISPDSMSFPDSLKFVTPGGKLVYGGGGILPDVIVGIDTIGGSWYLSELHYAGILNQFSFDFVDQNRGEFKKYATPKAFVEGYKIKPEMLEKLFNFASAQGLERNDEEIKTSKAQIETRLKALIGRNLFQSEGYYPIILQKDLAFKKALEVLNN